MERGVKPLYVNEKYNYTFIVTYIIFLGILLGEVQEDLLIYVTSILLM